MNARPVDRALQFDRQSLHDADRLPGADTRTWPQTHPQLAAAVEIGGALALALLIAGLVALIKRRR